MDTAQRGPLTTGCAVCLSNHAAHASPAAPARWRGRDSACHGLYVAVAKLDAAWRLERSCPAGTANCFWERLQLRDRVREQLQPRISCWSDYSATSQSTPERPPPPGASRGCSHARHSASASRVRYGGLTMSRPLPFRPSG